MALLEAHFPAHFVPPEPDMSACSACRGDWASTLMHLSSLPIGMQVGLAAQRVFDLGVCPFTGTTCP